jgi:F420-dependent hydroxymycolic acid dehydrogenase
MTYRKGGMSERKLSIGFVLSQEQFPTRELLDLGVEAEAAGFDEVWASDHFHPWQDNQGHAGHAWITLAALSQRTNRITIGTGVTCPTYRFRPADVAHAFATLSGLAPGRIFLGVGTGEALNEIPSGGGWGPYRERAARLEEAVTLIRRLWSEEWVTSDGPYYPVENANLYDKPPEPIPVYVAGGGPKSAALAGRVGDGWITGEAALLRQDRPGPVNAFRDGQRLSGADPGAARILIEQYAVVGGAPEAAEAARLWQFLPVARDLLTEPDPRAIERYARQRTTAAKAAERMLASPDPADHIERLRALHAAGATDVFIHAPQPDQRKVISFYAESVLPAF